MILSVPKVFSSEIVNNLSKEIEELSLELRGLNEAFAEEKQVAKDLHSKVYHLEASIPRVEKALEDKGKEVRNGEHMLELSQREAARVQAEIAGLRKQQDQHALQALRLETDCLKIEDRLNELAEAGNCTREELAVWAATELDRIEKGQAAAAADGAQAGVIADLHRKLKNASVEAAAAQEAAATQTAGAGAAAQQLEARLQRLLASRQDVRAVRQRLEGAESMADSRVVELSNMQGELHTASADLAEAQSKETQAAEELEEETAASRVLEVALRESEATSKVAEAGAYTAEAAAEQAERRLADSEAMLRRLRRDVKNAAAAQQRARSQAKNEASELAGACNEELELESRVLDDEAASLSAAEQRAAMQALLAGETRRRASLQSRFSVVSGTEAKTQAALATAKQSSSLLAMEVAQAVAHSASLEAQCGALQTQLANQQEKLYRADFEAIMARRAAATACLGGDSGQSEALRARKKELLSETAAAAATCRTLQRTVRKSEKDVMQAEGVKKEAEARLQALEGDARRAEASLEGAVKATEQAGEERDAVRLRVDREALKAHQAQGRLVAQARKVFRVNDHVLEGGKEASREEAALRQEIEALAQRERAEVRELNARKVELARRAAAVGVQGTALHALRAKRGNREERVATLCVQLEREVDELQASLEGAEADCAALEAALAQQHLATAATRSWGGAPRTIER